MGEDASRGVIKNRRYANQVKDYSGIRFGKITPTDIDGFIDFGDKAFVIIEVKYGDTDVPTGQKLAIERLCDSLNQQKPTVAIIARHDSNGDIDVGNCVATEIRYKRQWKQASHRITVKGTIDSFLRDNNLNWYI